MQHKTSLSISKLQQHGENISLGPHFLAQNITLIAKKVLTSVKWAKCHRTDHDVGSFMGPCMGPLKPGTGSRNAQFQDPEKVL